MQADTTIHHQNARFLSEVALLLLSLDRVMPFWEELGLHFTQPEHIKEAARRVVLEQQRTDHAHNASSLQQWQAFLGPVSDLEGDEVVGALREWIYGRFIAYETSGSWLDAWQSLLFLLDASQEPVLAKLGIAPEKIPALLCLAEEWAQAADELEDRIKQAEDQPLEGWDAAQYHIYQAESSAVSPLDYLSSHLRHLRFMKIWTELLHLLSPQERDILNTWGQVTAQTRTSIPPAYAEIPLVYRGQP